MVKIFLSKIWSLLSSTTNQLVLLALAFFAPISMLLWTLIILITIDAITAVIRDWNVSKKEGKKLFLFPIPFFITDRYIVFKSGKMKRTVVKSFLYITFVCCCYLLAVAVTGHHLYIAHGATAMMGLVELTSIAENNSMITGNNVFTNIIRKYVKKLNNSISSKME